MATFCVAAVFVFAYEIQTRDSRSEASVTSVTETTVLPQAGARLQFSATAYCKGETTASGVGVRTGIAAADPAILPVGSVVRLETACLGLREGAAAKLAEWEIRLHKLSEGYRRSRVVS